MLPRRLVLEAAPNGTLAGLHRLAGDLAGHLGWIPGAPGWPPAPQRSTILAVPPAESHRAWEDVLARARWLTGGARPGWLDAVSANPAASRDGATSAPYLFGRRADAAEATPHGRPVVIVSPAGKAAIRRNPKRALERLAAFARRHPGAEAVQVHDEHHLPTPVPLASLIAAVQAFSAAVSSMTDRKDLRHGRGATFDAQAAGDPDRGTAISPEMDNPTDDAGSDATAKTVLPDSRDGSTYKGSAHRARGHTVHPTFPAPTSDHWISQDADQQDELDPSHEAHSTNLRNRPQDADAPCALDDQPSPF